MVQIKTKESKQALDALVKEQGGGAWSTRNGEINNWVGGTQPTDAQIQSKMDELKIEYDAKEYARKRQEEYPTIEELVVALYDTEDKAAIDAKRAEIKLKYPK
jgi:hypothetical protein